MTSRNIILSSLVSTDEVQAQLVRIARTVVAALTGLDCYYFPRLALASAIMFPKSKSQISEWSSRAYLGILSASKVVEVGYA